MFATGLLLACLIPANPRNSTGPNELQLHLTPPLRKLCISAPAVVLARPVDPVAPTRFTVVEVLRGKGIKVGDRIGAGLQEKAVVSFDAFDLDTKKPRPRKVDLALLFLEQAEVDGALAPYRVVADGYRFVTGDGRVLSPGPFRVVGQPVHVSEGVKWAALLSVVRADLHAIDRLHAARSLARPRQRVAALTDWLQRRRGALAQVQSEAPGDLSPTGWYGLATEVFDWIFEDANPAESIAVVKLYASLHRGEVPRLKSPAFATVEGRKVLLDAVLDEKNIVGDRRRAVALLAAPLTWRSANTKERTALVEKLLPLLSLSGEMQIDLARAIVSLAYTEKQATEVKTLDALARAYRAADPGEAHDELGWSLFRLASPEQHRELTGNPSGVCVRVRNFSHDEGEITFFLDLHTSGAMAFEQPVLVVEKLGTLGMVAETRKVPLEVLNLPSPWADGLADAKLAVRLEASKVIALPSPGRTERGKVSATTFRLRIEGTVGKGSEKRTWRSEPRRISVMPPLQ